jgi:hypothetical protein
MRRLALATMAGGRGGQRLGCGPAVAGLVGEPAQDVPVPGAGLEAGQRAGEDLGLFGMGHAFSGGSMGPRGTGGGWAGCGSLAAGCRACLWCRLAEQAGERGDCFEQQRVETGLLVGGVAGVELGDRAAVPGLGGELACPGRDGGSHDGGRRGCRGCPGFWPGMVSPG